jgi:hypothetical protein
MLSGLFVKNQKKDFACKSCKTIIKADYDTDKPMKESDLFMLGFHINRHGINKDDLTKLLFPYYYISDPLSLTCKFCGSNFNIGDKISIISVSTVIKHTAEHLSIIDQCDMTDRFLSNYFNF